jgi:hypothetical protein
MNENLKKRKFEENSLDNLISNFKKLKICKKRKQEDINLNYNEHILKKRCLKYNINHIEDYKKKRRDSLLYL